MIIGINTKKVKIKSKLIGNFVPDNILLSVACACMLEIDKKYIEEGIYTCEYIDGRMEKIYENIFQTTAKNYPK